MIFASNEYSDQPECRSSPAACNEKKTQKLTKYEAILIVLCNAVLLTKVLYLTIPYKRFKAHDAIFRWCNETHDWLKVMVLYTLMQRKDSLISP